MPALVLLVVMRDRSVVVAWILCLAALFTIGLFGRPGILHVYVPLVTLLLVAPLHGWPAWHRPTRLAACTLSRRLLRQWLCKLIPRGSRSLRRKIRQAQQDILLLPQEPIVIWGGGFPFEYSIPAFMGGRRCARATHLWAGSSVTLAPFSVASVEEADRGDNRDACGPTAGVPFMCIAR